MIYHRPLLLLFCFFCTVVLGCAKLKPLKLNRISEFSIQPLSLSKSIISFNTCINNPNNYKIYLHALAADIELSGKPLGHFLLDSTVILLAKDSNMCIPVSFEAKNSVLLSSAFSALLTDSVSYTISGTAKGGRKQASIKFPFTYNGKLSSSMIK